jgi:hypothetical protein
MLRKLYLFTLTAALLGTAIGQTETEKKEKKSTLVFTGSLDGYFRSDFNNNVANNRTSFTNSNNKLALGMASAKVDYTIGGFSFTADLGAGKRMKEFAYNDKGALSFVKQIYASYAPADWIKITAGSWATHVGYELVDAYANRNYSMSYMFSYGPFLHTGVKTDFTFGASGLMIGIASPTDYRNAPDPNKKALLLQYSQGIGENAKFYINYAGGERPTDNAKTRQLDAVVTTKLNDKFNIGFNATSVYVSTPTANGYSDYKNWWGSAVYLNVDPSDKVGLTLRSEILSDKYQLSALGAAPSGARIFANTLSANFKLGPITLIPEIRLESASSGIYSNKTGEIKSGDASFLIGAHYKFSK